MADRKSLGIIGCLLGAVTAAVMAAALVVVQQHLDGRLQIDNGRPVQAASLPSRVQ
jgi:ABC-type lipoprotein release transport system permease subunit